MTEKNKPTFWKKIAAKIEWINTAQKIFMVDNLRVMLKAGLSIVEAFKILAAQAANPRLQNLVESVSREVEKGKTLADTLAKFSDFLPQIYVKMLAAGEISGKLDETLAEIVKQMKKTQEMNSKVRGAMIYPAVILLAVTGVGIEMVVFVLPKLLELFKELNVTLPLPTRILIAVSNLLINYGLWLLILLIALVIAFFYFKKKPMAQWQLDGLLLRMPIFGRVSRQLNLARFTLTLGSLLRSAIPIIEAFDITAQVLGNSHYRKATQEVGRKLKTGATIAESLEAYPRLFPPLTTQMIMVGEKSGATEDLLNELANYYGNEVDQILKNISTIIEPALIIFLGLVVGGLAVAVIMPMYSLSQGI